ncbi:MAG: hypothetical protein V7642_4207, partial [Burkholderiales bacterium]
AVNITADTVATTAAHVLAANQKTNYTGGHP